MERLINIFLTSRPKQQFKNILVIIPFVLSANLWIGISSQIISNLVSDLLMGLASFVLGSWFIYIINDSVDKNTDKGHPEKSKRPIVSGKLSGKVIIATSLIILISSLVIGFAVNTIFLFALLAYLILMTLYSLYIKKLFFLDIISVASGYMLRVYAGAAIVTNNISNSLGVSVWLILCTGFASLFVLSIKRFSELNNDELSKRSSLNTSKFNSTFLNYSINFSEFITYISYAFYCISINFFSIFKGNTPSDLSLLLTLPLVIMGMRRFKKDSINSTYGDQPEEVIFKSNFIKIIFISWIIFSALIIYFRN